MTLVPLYERPIWESAPEQAMRPGGLSVTGQALSFCALPRGARVLDVGCGAGATLRYLAEAYQLAGFGVDVSGVLLARARRAGVQAGLSRALGEYLPIASESMDAVISECTLSIFEVDSALCECYRVIKPGGYFIVNDLYARNASGAQALRQLPAGTCISAAMPEAEILEKVNSCGLRVVAWQDFSEKLKEFSICTLTNAVQVDPFDLVIAAGKAKLGYYLMVAQKV